MLTVVCAHRSEADPLIESGRMSGVEGSRNLFHGDDARLIVTGQGISQCGETLRRVGHPWLPKPGQWWLNFGLAGNGTETGPGRLVLVNRVEHAGDVWSPGDAGIEESMAKKYDLVTGGVLRTVASPEIEFRDPVLYDMEASEIARFLHGHGCLPRLVVIKMVADGPGLNDSQRMALAKSLLSRNRQRIGQLGDMLGAITKKD